METVQDIISNAIPTPYGKFTVVSYLLAYVFLSEEGDIQWPGLWSESLNKHSPILILAPPRPAHLASPPALPQSSVNS